MKGEQNAGNLRAAAVGALAQSGDDAIDRSDGIGGVEDEATVVGKGAQAVLLALELGDSLAGGILVGRLVGRKAEHVRRKKYQGVFRTLVTIVLPFGSCVAPQPHPNRAIFSSIRFRHFIIAVHADR